jgi:hypothetical protein
MMVCMPLGFDDFQHKVSFGHRHTVLQPLSYRVLKALADGSGHAVATDALVSTVWEGAAVSPETLKQRIFLLRKALEDAGWNNVKIDAVRGQGYRLLVQYDEGAAKHEGRSFRFYGVFVAVIALFIIGFAAFYFLRVPSVLVSNRVVLWSSHTQTEHSVVNDSLYESWRSVLLEASGKGQFQIIQSARRAEMPIPIQARKTRAGLISFFEVIPSDGRDRIRLSIIEPTTATILRSDLLDTLDPNQATHLFDSQIKGINALIASGKLRLEKKYRDDADHAVWEALRMLAHASN